MRIEPSSPSEELTIEFIELYSNKNLRPVVASNFIPEWYKNQNSYYEYNNVKDLTIKRCIPFLDAMSAGYFLVTTEDHVVSDNKISTIEDQDSISMHMKSQFGSMPINDQFVQEVFKWKNPFLIKTPKDISCTFIHPSNWNGLPFMTMSGVVDTDKFINPVTIPFFLYKNFSGIIPKNTPVVQIIPFRRESFNIKLDLKLNKDLIGSHSALSQDYESLRYDNDGNPTGGIYKRKFWTRKKYK